jgi:hypothetical protein
MMRTCEVGEAMMDFRSSLIVHDVLTQLMMFFILSSNRGARFGLIS